MIRLLSQAESQSLLPSAYITPSSIKKFSAPPQANHCHAFVRNLIQYWLPPENCIIVTAAFNIFPSAEIPELNKRIRISQGLDPSFHAFPGELVESPSDSEREYLLCRFAHSLVDLNDFSYKDLSREFSIHISHDEWIGIECEEPSLETELLEFIRQYI